MLFAPFCCAVVTFGYYYTCWDKTKLLNRFKKYIFAPFKNNNL